MAHHKSNVCATGTARSSPAGGSKDRTALSLDSALQLFLKSRRPLSRQAPSSETKSLALLRLALALNPSLSSLPKAKALLLQRYLDRARPPPFIRRGKLYKRFLLRRLLWRSTRRPSVNVDLINRLRLIQADEPSSDEDSCLTLNSFSSRPSSASEATILTIPDRSDEETNTICTKRKRDSIQTSASPGEDVAEASRLSKRAKETDKMNMGKPQEPSPNTNNDKAAVTAPETQPGGVKKLQKRKLDGEKSAAANEQQHQRAIKKIPPETAKPESTAAQTPQQPAPVVRQKEYFQKRVDDMLTDPLGFDDFVYGTNKPIPRYVQKQFARCRRRQREPTPPLVMSGAIGRAPDVRPATNKQSRSLAKDAQKRAHQQKVKERVESLKGKPTAGGKAGHMSPKKAESKQLNSLKRYIKSPYP
ncbi:hypothetical protein VTK26DRAFT_6751 [Humicola hyalothermophila]